MCNKTDSSVLRPTSEVGNNPGVNLDDSLRNPTQVVKSIAGSYLKKLSPSHRLFVLLLVALVVLYIAAYNTQKRLYLTGILQIYHAVQSNDPQWADAAGHTIASVEGNTKTNAEGFFELPIGHFLPPFLPVNLVMSGPGPARAVTIPNRRIWKLFPPLEGPVPVYYAPDTEEKYFFNDTETERAVDSYKQQSQSLGQELHFPTSGDRFPKAVTPVLSFLPTANAQETEWAVPAEATAAVLLHSLTIYGLTGAQDVLIRGSVDGRTHYSQTVLVAPDQPAATLIPEQIPFEANDTELTIDVAVPVLLQLPFLSHVVATCTIDLGAVSPGQVLSESCSSPDGEPSLVISISFQVVPALSVGYFTRSLGANGYGALFWLRVARDDLMAIEDVIYDLGPLYTPRTVSTPLIDERDFYMYAVRLYTSALPMNARVRLRSGFTWEGAARILPVGREPTTAAAYFAKGLLYSMHDATDMELEIARDAYHSAFEADSEFARAKAFEGAVASRLGERDESLTHLNEALTRDENDPVIRNELAWALAQSDSHEDLELAKEYAMPGRNSENASPLALDTLGWIHFRLEEYDLARDALLEARRLQRHLGESVPVWQVIHYHLARVYVKLEETELAGEAFENVVEFHEDWPLNSTAAYVEEAREYLDGTQER